MLRNRISLNGETSVGGVVPVMGCGMSTSKSASTDAGCRGGVREARDGDGVGELGHDPVANMGVTGGGVSEGLEAEYSKCGGCVFSCAGCDGGGAYIGLFGDCGRGREYIRGVKSSGGCGPVGTCVGGGAFALDGCDHALGGCMCAVAGNVSRVDAGCAEGGTMLNAENIGMLEEAEYARLMEVGALWAVRMGGGADKARS